MDPEPLPVKRFTSAEVCFIFLFLIFVVENVVFCISLYLLGNVNAGLLVTALLLFIIIVPIVGLQRRSALCMDIFGSFILITILMINLHPLIHLSFSAIISSVYYFFTACLAFFLAWSYRLERKPIYTV